MYWILNGRSIGLSTRQNELIELSLTHKFAGFDIDINEFHSQATESGIEYAMRFISSAPVKLGAFELPVRWQGEVANYKIDLSNLDAVCQTAIAIGAKTCYSTVLPYSDQLPYHENFDLARERLAEIGSVLENHGIRLGINFLAASHHREGHGEPFITKAEELSTLVKTVGSSSIGLCLDTWNWYVGGGTLEQLKGIDVNNIVMVRIADVPADAELSKVTDKQRLVPRESSVVPVADIIKHLDEQGFSGAIVPFFHPSQFSSRNKDAVVRGIREAIDRLFGKGLVAEEAIEEQEPAEEEVVAAT
ncbi:MAG: TIM barrel protein [Planctomycetales bacterium]|nr:TIM barrel protein [Planctomycetales bacterium]